MFMKENNNDHWQQLPIVKELKLRKEILWINEDYQNNFISHYAGNVTKQEIIEASERLQRFAPFIKNAFPETLVTHGIIESPLLPIYKAYIELEKYFGQQIDGKFLLKCDHLLPISGSIKARGGIYEVLMYAEELAMKNSLLKISDDYSILADKVFKDLFSYYSIAVGSTGNLGLSIGIIGAKLGFNVTVHMSIDAKKWKKDLLRSLGVTVIEYESDYTMAVDEGRKQAALDPYCYFVDDESSKHLFLGYAVAAFRLEKQLAAQGIIVDEERPLFIYLPCGVGGGPGGIAFGLKTVYQQNVHCFFIEPTESPCLLLGMASGLGDKVSVNEIGLSNQTVADGLAVGTASNFVMNTMTHILSGVFTIKDETLFPILKTFFNEEEMFLEPAAVAGAIGPFQLLKSEVGRGYIEQAQLSGKMKQATHIIWATGGSMVPLEVREEYLKS
jgi:D-serine dehydratase